MISPAFQNWNRFEDELNCLENEKIIKEIDLSQFFNDAIFKLKINISETESITGLTFKELILENEKADQPFVLALIKTKRQGIDRFYSYFDAKSLRQWLDKKPIHPIHKTPVNQVIYYSIDSLNKNFSYFNYEYRKKDNKNKDNPNEFNKQTNFLNFYFRAHSHNQEDLKFLSYDYEQLSHCYFQGVGITKNLNKSFEFMLKSCENASDKSNGKAEHALGLKYYHGEGTIQNDEKAFEWIHKSALKGFANAQSNLGVCYNKGICIEKNTKEAIYWFKKAAKQKHPHAYVELACLYYSEDHKDVKKAIQYAKKAIENQDKDAEYVLGTIYLTEKKDKDARIWLEKAVLKGNVQAKESLKELDDRLLKIK